MWWFSLKRNKLRKFMENFIKSSNEIYLEKSQDKSSCHRIIPQSRFQKKVLRIGISLTRRQHCQATNPTTRESLTTLGVAVSPTETHLWLGIYLDTGICSSLKVLFCVSAVRYVVFVIDEQRCQTDLFFQ